MKNVRNRAFPGAWDAQKAINPCEPCCGGCKTRQICLSGCKLHPRYSLAREFGVDVVALGGGRCRFFDVGYSFARVSARCGARCRFFDMGYSLAREVRVVSAMWWHVGVDAAVF